MLPNLKCGGAVVNEFRVMRGRNRGSFARGTESSNSASSSQAADRTGRQAAESASRPAGSLWVGTPDGWHRNKRPIVVV
jgi:hypothetical protein